MAALDQVVNADEAEAFEDDNEVLLAHLISFSKLVQN